MSPQRLVKRESHLIEFFFFHISYQLWKWEDGEREFLEFSHVITDWESRRARGRLVREKNSKYI